MRAFGPPIPSPPPTLAAAEMKVRTFWWWSYYQNCCWHCSYCLIWLVGDVNFWNWEKNQEKTQEIVLQLLQCNQLVCKEIVIVSPICQGAMTHEQNLNCCLVVVRYHCCLKRCLFDGYGWWWAPSQKVPDMVRARKYDGTPRVLTILLLGSDFADNLVVVSHPFQTWLREFQIPTYFRRNS